MEKQKPDDLTAVETIKPANLSNLPSNFAKDVNDYFNHFVMVTDAKAGACLAANLAVMVVVVTFEYSSILTRILIFLALTAFALSGLSCGAVIFPRLPRGKRGVIFWEDIRSFPTFEEYYEKLSNMTEEKINEEYAQQNYLISNVLHKKHYWLQRGILLFGLGVVLSLLTYLLIEFV